VTQMKAFVPAADLADVSVCLVEQLQRCLQP